MLNSVQQLPLYNIYFQQIQDTIIKINSQIKSNAGKYDAVYWQKFNAD